MKTNYFIISIERNGKRLAYVKGISENYNLKGLLPSDAVTITAARSRKKAIETAAAWNSTWKNDNVLLLDGHFTGVLELKNNNAYWE